MHVRLNLATKPLETHRRFFAGSGLAATVAGVVFLLLAWNVYSVRKANAEMRKRSDEIRQQMIAAENQRRELEQFFNQRDIATLHDRAAFLNSIIDARSFNWTRMFMDLERVLPSGVHVLSIEPKQSSGRVELKLTIGATSDEAKLQFLHALEESHQFRDVYELNEHKPSVTGTPTTDQKVVQLTTTYSRT